MTTDYEAIRNSVADKLADWGITYTACFVPQSASRNSASKDKSINWRVSFSTKKLQCVATDYSQGIGHIPGLSSSHNKLAHERDYRLRLATEKGQHFDPATLDKNGFPKNTFVKHVIPLPTPTAADVLSCLLLDSRVNDFACFEDWALEYGYDPDSRNAEDIYNACRIIARDFFRVFTPQQRAELETLLQDY